MSFRDYLSQKMHRLFKSFDNWTLIFGMIAFLTITLYPKVGILFLILAVTTIIADSISQDYQRWRKEQNQ